jgi:hypothetical protein
MRDESPKRGTVSENIFTSSRQSFDVGFFAALERMFKPAPNRAQPVLEFSSSQYPVLVAVPVLKARNRNKHRFEWSCLKIGSGQSGKRAR